MIEKLYRESCSRYKKVSIYWPFFIYWKYIGNETAVAVYFDVIVLFQLTL